MKKKLLLCALTCATLAMAAMPSAMAAQSSASGIVSSYGDGITFTGSSYSIMGTSTSATLSDDVDTCYVDASGISSASKYFTVTDTDNVTGHYITVATSDENFSVGTGGSTIPTSNLSLSLEGNVSVSTCPTASSNEASDIAAKLAGPTGSDLTSLSLSTGVYDSSSDIAFQAMSTTPTTIITSEASEAFQYKFRIGALKMTFPQYTKPGTYSTDLVYTYNAST